MFIRILLYYVNIQFTEENPRFFLRNLKRLDFHHDDSYDHIRRSVESLSRNEKDALNLVEKVHQVLIKEPPEKEGIKSFNFLEIQQYNCFTEDSTDLLHWQVIIYCTLLEDNQNKEDANKLNKECKDQRNLCEKILEYLNNTCTIIKCQLEANTNLTEQSCKEMLKKCRDLRSTCNGSLDLECERIKNECEKINITIPENPDSKPILPPEQEKNDTSSTTSEVTSTSTEESTAIESVTTIPINTYTGTGSIITHITTLVIVDATDAITEFETTTSTVTLCQCTSVGTCTHTETPICSETQTDSPSPDPSMEPTLDPTLDPTLEPIDPTEPEIPEEPEQPEEPSLSTESCSTMETLTVTVEPTKGSDDDKECPTNSGLRLKGLYTDGIICMIIGMIIGIWVII
ncbi:hypothetical protein PCANB_000256 [Pneumocystis canis]|nr:hypothetical protein PCANB_000256 [Pneumocystis canis]